MSFLPRCKLPAWCTPPEDTELRYSIFFSAGSAVREFVFTPLSAGVVFEGEFLYAPTGSHEVQKSIYPIPGEVLIAAGVEALRRAKGEA